MRYKASRRQPFSSHKTHSADNMGSTAVHIWQASVYPDIRTKCQRPDQMSTRENTELSKKLVIQILLGFVGTFLKSKTPVTFFYLKKQTLIFLQGNKHQKSLILDRCEIICPVAWAALFSNKTQTRDTKEFSRV